MKKKIKVIIFTTIGWIFVLFGIVGIFLPFLQGILFILVGLYVLSHYSPWAQRVLNNVRRHFPGLDKKLHEARIKAKNLFK